jgi:cytochrome c553
MMRIQILLTMVFLGLMQAAAADNASADMEQGAVKAEACLACHNVMVSLKGEGADAILEQMKAIRAGDQSHPPGLEDLKEEDLAIIAAYLDSAD